MNIRSEHSVEKLEQLLMLRVLASEFTDAGQLPSRSALAKEYGVCRNTVGAAVGRLIARGVCVSRTGAGIEIVDLVRALDHRLLLELIVQAQDVSVRLELLAQLLTVVRQILAAAAADAARNHRAEHLEALDRVNHAQSSRLLAGDAWTSRDASDEYETWRIVAAASGSLATTSALNALRSLWLNAAVLHGLLQANAPWRSRRLTEAIRQADAQASSAAASEILLARERAVEQAVRSVRGLAETGPPTTQPSH